jgi:hypothetical protein
MNKMIHFYNTETQKNNYLLVNKEQDEFLDALIDLGLFGEQLEITETIITDCTAIGRF